MTVWYKHTLEFGDDNALGLTGGIIDSTAYIDENAYANDEYTQFMNEALVSGPNGFAPSYDIGGEVEWELGRWAIKGVGMNIGENDFDYTLKKPVFCWLPSDPASPVSGCLLKILIKGLRPLILQYPHAGPIHLTLFGRNWLNRASS